MSGSTLRRAVLSALILSLLLPLASHAVPVMRSEGTLNVVQLPDWSSMLRSISELLGLVRPATEKNNGNPPDVKPGRELTWTRDGNGFDPHGKP